MLTSQFEIVLTQPLIISQQAASAGAHQSLDYIPGSVLLGLVASRLYARLDADSAWTVFHSGRIVIPDLKRFLRAQAIESGATLVVASHDARVKPLLPHAFALPAHVHPRRRAA